MSNPETWNPVPEWEPYYEISNKGRVRSLRSGKILNPALSRDGYPFVNLSAGGLNRVYRVHRLVAKAFLPCDAAEKTLVNHENSDRSACTVENLTWCTHAENVKHGVIHGYMLDYSAELVQSAIESYRSGASQQEISESTGISRGYLSSLINGKGRKYEQPDGVKKYNDTAYQELSETAEEWREVTGFEHMAISNKGRCKRLSNGRVLSPVRMSIGYYKYALRRDNKTFQLYAHRLVADAFLPKPPDNGQKWVVNHKRIGPDGGRGTLNDVRNLEWVTHRNNLRHAYGHTYVTAGV